ncbi:carboxypeptidase-like regulatory domain-containing protein [Flavobacteriaceae bacterium 3-367]
MKNVMIGLILLLGYGIQAQQKNQVEPQDTTALIINGKVLEHGSQKLPLPGATVTIRGTEKGTKTNFDGEFSIKAKKGDRLVFTYLGFKTIVHKISEPGEVVVKLREDATACFVDRSYYLPFTIYTLDNTNWFTQQDIYNSIQARVPGVRIGNTQFNQTPVIALRGGDTPIIIVDGIRYTDTSILNALNPQDIEKIEVANSVAASNYLLNNRN